MRKSFISILLMTIVLFVAGCSKEGKLQEIYDDKPSIRGVVKEISDDTILLESKDRVQSGDIRVSTRTELEDGLIDFEVGDVIIVYYDGNIVEVHPPRINKVFAFELEKKAESIKQDKNSSEDGEDYYSMPKLSVVHNDNSTNLADNESAFVHDLISTVEWDKGSIEEFEPDYMIIDDVDVLVTFNSKSHTLNDTRNDISTVLPENLSKALKEILDK